VSGCIAGAGILAEVVVSKFAEHSTLYRFEDISTRYGLHLPRSTLCDWVRNVADLLKPLYQLQKDLVQTAPVIWTDDTHVKFLRGEEPGSHKGQFWVYIGPTVLPYDVYDFTEDRKRVGPRILAEDQTASRWAKGYRPRSCRRLTYRGQPFPLLAHFASLSATSVTTPAQGRLRPSIMIADGVPVRASHRGPAMTRCAV
jgi:hypothetical protein